MTAKTVVVVSQDEALASELANGLGAGTRVTVVPSPAELNPNDWGIVVLETRSFRDVAAFHRWQAESGMPLIAITSGGDQERIGALQAGADDCMTRPVNIAELVARIGKISDRMEQKSEPLPASNEPALSCDGLNIDPRSRQVKVNGTDVELTAKEYDLLLLLARRKGRVVSRREILRRVWGDSNLYSDRTIDVHVCRLRRKIEGSSFWPRRLVLVRGLGYKLACEQISDARFVRPEQRIEA